MGLKNPWCRSFLYQAQSRSAERFCCCCCTRAAIVFKFAFGTNCRRLRSIYSAFPLLLLRMRHVGWFEYPMGISTWFQSVDRWLTCRRINRWYGYRNRCQLSVAHSRYFPSIDDELWWFKYSDMFWQKLRMDRIWVCKNLRLMRD